MKTLQKKAVKKVLLDADVISHFIKGRRLLLLPRLYPNQIVILDKVKDEIERSRSRELKMQTDGLLAVKGIERKKFPDDMNVIKEYARLMKQGLGSGESACMACARYDETIIIASSNIRDIKGYCDENGIECLTTMDILLEAYLSGLLTEEESNAFIWEVKEKRSILPVDSIRGYIDRFGK